VREFSVFVANAPDRPEVARQFADALGRIPPEHVLTMLCAILQQDHREQLARITTPTLILQSREDPFVPEPVAALMHARIPGSEYRIIESRGHFPQLYAPELLAEAVHRFLA
jgi:sigma-B regulation protein RsbQ